MAVIHPRRADKFLFIIIYLKVFYGNHSPLTHGLFRIKCLQFSEIEGNFNQLYLIGSSLNCSVVKGCRTLCVIKTTHFSVINFMAWHISLLVCCMCLQRMLIGKLQVHCFLRIHLTSFVTGSLHVHSTCPFDRRCNWSLHVYSY